MKIAVAGRRNPDHMWTAPLGKHFVTRRLFGDCSHMSGL
jgi:hypothetical protein